MQLSPILYIFWKKTGFYSMVFLKGNRKNESGEVVGGLARVEEEVTAVGV